MKTGFRRRAVPMVVTIGIITTAAGLSIGQHMRVAAEPDIPPWPTIPVHVHTVALERGYAFTSRYAGQIEPARAVSLAFERQGKVTAVAVDEGARVQAGQVLATLDTDPLRARRDQLLAQKAALKARRGLALKTTGRQTTLAKRGFSSRQTLDEARFEASALAAEMEAIDAAVAGIDIDIAKSTLTAPFAGEIALRHLDEGAIAQSGAPVLRIIEADVAEARIGVPPAVAASLTVGTTYTMTTGDRELGARLDRLGPDLSSATRTVAAVFTLVTRRGVPFGETLVFEREAEVETPGSWIPITALTEGARGLWTVHAVRDGRLVRESVEVLRVAGDQAFVRGTLTDGMRIVSGGLDRAVPGQPVDPINSGDSIAAR